MIQVNELRIGNYVGVSNLAFHHLDNHPDNTFEIEQLRKDIVFFKGFHAGEYYHDLCPIPLTEEVLLKYGATTWPSGGLLLENRLITFAECRKTWVDSSTSVDLLHLHQLQNLIYALTGEELEVKI